MDISFSGFKNVEPIADQQIGPTCWAEATENLIQLDNQYFTNNVSQRLFASAARFPGYDPKKKCFVSGDFNQYILELLKEYRIEGKWYAFDHNLIFEALDQNRGVMLCGYAYYLHKNYEAYRIPEETPHEIILTDAKYDGNQVLWYEGIDSNFGGQTMRWSWTVIQNFAVSYQNHQRIPGVLITNRALRWPHKT